MSFGFSPSDFIVAYELARKIHHRCFTKAQRADVKYLQFGSDIDSLGESLKRLHDILVNADKQRPKEPWHGDDTERVASGVVKTLEEISGDFLHTLRDCERLLNDKSKFSRSASGFIDNVAWHSSTERDVNRLRDRVHFHMVKLDFIAKPFEIQLLLGIRRQLQQLSRQVAELRALLDWDPTQERHAIKPNAHGTYFSVPEPLSDRFRKARASKDPESYQVRDDLPLKEGVDALVYHFAESTVHFKPDSGLGQQVPADQYLNLVKSKWILDRLKESTYFATLNPESLYIEYLKELEDQVRDQLVRFQQSDLHPPSLDDLCRLPDNCYSISVDTDSCPSPAAQTEHRPGEEKILELALQNGSRSTHPSTLTIFRQSETALRLVQATKDEQNEGFLREESNNVDMVHTGLVPIFAASQDNSIDNSILLRCNAGQDTYYNLRGPRDVAQFQRALTGFRVSHDMSHIALHIELSSLRKPSISGQARLQFWHLKPLARIQQSEDSEPSEGDSTSSDPAPSSPVGSLQLRRFWTSGTTQLPGSSTVSLVNGSRGNGIALTCPELPVLIIFTKCERKYAFLHLQMESSVFWELQPCHSCRSQKKPCSRILIRSKSKKFTARKLSAQQEGDQGLRTWNLGCFRYPEHPDFKKLETLNLKYLSLHFDTPDQKDEFCQEFNLLENLRNKDKLDYERVLKETKHGSNKLRSR